MSDKKVLVVFYSRGGNTRAVAEEFRKKFKADLEEIVDTRNRKGILGYILAGRDASQNKLTVIKPTKYNPSDYDLVIIGSPIWASRVSTPVRTYIEENKARFKKAALFCTGAGDVKDKAWQDLEALCGIKPEFILGFSRKAIKEKTYISSIEKL
jgi:flavodoxin